MVAANGDVGADGERAQAVAGVFQHRFTVVFAIGNGGNQVAHMAVGHVFQFGNGGLYGGHAVFVEQADQIALAHAAGAVLGV